MSNNHTPYRHVYLPGLSAYDTSHQRAAAFELSQGPNSPTPNHQAGYVFFDTVEAKRTAKLDFSKRAYDIRKQLARGNLAPYESDSLQRELEGINHARQYSTVVDQAAVNPGLPHNDTAPSDVLIVKGHGNPNNPDSISTRTTDVVGTSHLAPGAYFYGPTDVTIKRGHRARHTAKEIAGTVKNINGMLASPGLDVRITSCGSAGSASSFLPFSNAHRHQHSFAGSVSRELDTMGANRGIVVSGYIGDANSSHPSNDVSDGFVSKIKQQADGRTFDMRRMNYRNSVAAPVTDTDRLKETISTDTDLISGMEHLFPGKNAPQTSTALQAKIESYTKVTTKDGQRINVTSAPRSSARVQFPRR